MQSRRPTAIEIGRRLTHLRGPKSIAQVAKDLNLSRMTIWQYEAGRRIPGDVQKIAIAKYYETTVEKIFFLP